MAKLTIRGVIALALIAATPATAQQPAQAPANAKAPAASPYTRAVAAGYKALTLCSALFNARAMRAVRSAASVDSWEMKGIYSEYDPLVGAMPASIGADRVTVPFDPALPPRVAISHGREGCVIQPVGADPALPNRAAEPFPASPIASAGRLGSPTS